VLGYTERGRMVEKRWAEERGERKEGVYLLSSALSDPTPLAPASPPIHQSTGSLHSRLARVVAEA
jgi:hypothetical protein